ncbi:MAG: magnesium/cobalt transporter CorA [Verrucomicrobiota bacterium]|nr:magnesium/cobalt transporter CorA [Verrucomicrobiota bacterium]
MIRSFVFNQTQGRLISQDVSTDLLNVFLYDDGVQLWVDIQGSDEEAKAILDGIFHFHPLAVEDCLAASERCKADEYENCVFMVIHSVGFSAAEHEFKTTELNLFIGKNCLVTFHRAPVRCVEATVERIRRNAPAVARAPDRLTYTILDFLLDSFEPAIENLAGDIADLEANVLSRRPRDVIGNVMKLKAEVQRLRLIVGPQREVISRLAHGEFKIVRAHMLPYYRDLLDQLVRIATLADTYRESLSNTLDIHFSLQQNEVNRVTKVLTILATLSMPILIVTSFYGMNFHHWPEFESKCAYAWVFGVTFAGTALLYWLLRLKRWW